MNFQVGDPVIHSSHGFGKIVKLDEKTLSGRSKNYYVVQTRELTIWVPIDETGKCSLRHPTPRSEFKHLFAIMRSPAEPLSTDRLERKNQLHEKMMDGKIESICIVIRDLAFFHQSQKFNDYDVSVMNRARQALIGEWCLVENISTVEAEKQLLLELPSLA